MTDAHPVPLDNLFTKNSYNAWGEHTVTNHTSANIGNINPFRYRDYYYDTETGFYYLNARYYDPSNGTDIVLFNDIPFNPNHLER